MNTINNVNSVSFQGSLASKLQGRRSFIQRKASGILHQSYKDVVELSKDASGDKLNFFDALIDEYNQFNFYRKQGEKDNSKLVNNIFEMVKNPKKIHFDITSRFGDSFENMSRIFAVGQNKKKYLQFAKKLNDDIVGLYSSASKDFIPELLESPFVDKYIKNYKDIKPYLVAYKDKPDAVNKLNKMFENKTYDKDLFNVELNEYRIKNEFSYNGTDVLNKDVYFDNFNKYSHELMHTLKIAVRFNDDVLQNGADKSILHALQTSNKENVELRRDLTRSLSDSFNELDNEVKAKRVNSLVRIFDKIDSDSHAKNFIKNSIDSIPDTIKVEDIDEILTKVPTKKLDIFRKNAWNIIVQTERAERISELNNNIKDPFYLSKFRRANFEKQHSYGMASSPSFIGKIAIRVKNGFNILRDKITAESPIVAEVPKSIEKIVEKPRFEEKVKVASVKPEIKPEVKPEIKIAETSSGEVNVTEKVSKSKIRKQIVADNVISFVTPKLGKKTLATQNELYTKNATKIRLSMLPEIFASVVDTRKVDRAVGKKHSKSANKDVLDLYLKIKGSNRKFVNYLLKKRNVDNTRMFEIKDIIEMIDKAEAKIAKDKKLNPEYRARDARRYYNYLYETKVTQFGKLQPQRKLSANA